MPVSTPLQEGITCLICQLTTQKKNLPFSTCQLRKTEFSRGGNVAIKKKKDRDIIAKSRSTVNCKVIERLLFLNCLHFLHFCYTGTIQLLLGATLLDLLRVK